MKNIKYLTVGLLRALGLFVLSPILVPLMIIDILMWIGGADPFNTPIRKAINKLEDWKNSL